MAHDLSFGLTQLLAHNGAVPSAQNFKGLLAQRIALSAGRRRPAGLSLSPPTPPRPVARHAGLHPPKPKLQRNATRVASGERREGVRL
eukprot:scaffold47242_cov35-Tisochrysis_lutea.AAC.4